MAEPTTQVGLGVGERVPDFVAPLEGGGPTRFYARAGGRPAVLVFAPLSAEAPEAILAAIGEAASRHLVVPDEATAEALDGIDVFRDDGNLAAACRVPEDDAVHALVLDRNLRTVAYVRSSDDGGIDMLQKAITEAAATEPARTVTAQAPVMFVPRIMEASRCRQLLDLWSQSHVETGVERSFESSRSEVLEAESKRRQDHIVQDKQLLRDLTQTIGRRLIPELRRTFAYGADRFEGFKIACYDASSSGFFHPHRDNLSPSTAHRRFAMSLNLNDDYEGGEIRFPEYGDSLYRPATGEALLFSCALLHEVLPVTAGRRFALLSFLFGPEVERQPSPETKG
jgi:predicted 2-oxoglutarate/Fe(II)-dependent dioxygenase YbiX